MFKTYKLYNFSGKDINFCNFGSINAKFLKKSISIRYENNKNRRQF